MPPKPNLRFKPKQTAPHTDTSPPLTSFQEDDFDEDVSLEEMARQLQQASGLGCRGVVEYGELDALYSSGKHTSEAIDDIRLYPKTAPHLPANTMSSLLATDNVTATHGHVYTPIPLNHKDAMRAAAAATGSGSSPRSVAKRPTAGTATAAVKAEEEDRGVAFLKEGAQEDERAWQANRRFHEQILKPNVATSSSSSASRDNEGDLVWLQIPRFYENAPFDLSTMDPGKVGELVVLKSGRMLLRIHNVYYDVSASCEEEHPADRDATGSAPPNGGKALEGPCSMAVISNSTASSHVVGGDRPSVSCYEVGLLTKKLICTPTITESS